MTNIIYTNVASEHTVKPTQTMFKNSTDKSIMLNYENGTNETVAVDATTAKTSKTITNINYGAQYYYSAQGNDYTIGANKVVSIERDGSNLVMRVP